MRTLGDVPHAADRGRPPEAASFFYDALASTHENIFFDEALLDGGCATRQSPQRAIFEGQESWLDAFPGAAAGGRACAVRAPERAHLYRGYDWTGRPCAWGRSPVWRFLLDSTKRISGRKLPSEAFGDDSAGTQSDKDLIAFRKAPGPTGVRMPGPRQGKAGPENLRFADVPGRFARRCNSPAMW